MHIYLYISLIGILIASYLVYFNLKRNPSILYLGAFFFFLSLFSLANFVIYRSHSAFLISIFYVNFGHFAYLIGPFSYLYVRSILSDNSKIKWKDLWHLTPMFVSLILAFPYIFSDYEYKKEIAYKIANNYEFLIHFSPTIATDYLSNQSIYISRPIHIAIYTLFNLFLIFKYTKTKHKKPQSESLVIRWLYTYNIFQVLVVCSYILSIKVHFAVNNEIINLYMGNFEKATMTCLFLLMISPTFFPKILYGLPIEDLKEHRRDLNEEIVMNSNENEEIAEKTPLKSTIFTEDYLNSLFLKVEESMHEHHLYIQSKLNLRDLSESLGIPEYHLKHLFSNYKNYSFKEYCDQFRVEHSIRLLEDPKFSNMTLEAIALSSGFSNRNSFTKSFQKYTGKNPSEYKIS